MGQNRGKGGAILTSNELVFPFVDSYVCANFGENRSRNATVRVLADGQTDRQTQTDFIICPMLYAIAMRQIVIIPVAKDPAGLLCTDDKRPDGMTLIPWRAGKPVVWDVTL